MNLVEMLSALILSLNTLLSSLTGITPTEPASQQRLATTTIRINNQELFVEIAQTQKERETGLSGKQKLKSNQGLLFIFPNNGYHGIWMKDMNFAIDIIWLNADKIIITTKEAIATSTYPSTFYPNQPARYIIELPENTVSSYNLKVGQPIKFD